MAPFTAMAIGALSQYLRFCLHVPFSDINPVDYLFDTNYMLSPDKLSTYEGEAGLPIMEHATQRRPKNAAALVGFDNRNLNHNFAEESRKYEMKNKVNRDDTWPKLIVNADLNPVFEENDRSDEDGGVALEVQEEEDSVDYSFPPDDVINVVDDSQNFGVKDTKDRGIQDGGYDSYYDNMDDDNAGDQPLPWRFFDHIRSAKLTHSSQVMTAADSNFNAVVAVGRTYAVLLGVMFFFIWLLYKILNRRRVYRYNRSK